MDRICATASTTACPPGNWAPRAGTSRGAAATAANCVEAMRLGDGRVALRQSTDPDGPALIYTHREMERFIQGAKAGEADFLLSAAPCRPRERRTA